MDHCWNDCNSEKINILKKTPSQRHFVQHFPTWSGLGSNHKPLIQKTGCR